MHKIIKKIISVALIFAITLSINQIHINRVEAAEKKCVMILTVTQGSESISAKIYAIKNGENYDFEIENTEFCFRSKKKETFDVTVSVEDTDLIDVESVDYNEKIIVEKDITTSTSYLNFTCKYGTKSKTLTYPYSLIRIDADAIVESVAAITTSKGFKPGGGNYVLITAKATMNSAFMEAPSTLRVRILDKSGKYVYQKKIDTYGEGGGMELKWDGKATKGNTAKIKKGSYVKKGTYTVEVCASANHMGIIVSDVKTTKLKVSSKAVSGVKGISKIKKTPIYTGDAEIDYIAEKMIKSAKVKMKMSDEQKVKKIYHWITTSFKHVHYDSNKKYKVYYNTRKLKSKINSFKKKSDKKVNQEKIAYNGYGIDEKWNMQRRIGVCDDHAAIFKILCNHVGVNAGTCGGYYKNRDGSKAGHAWNYAVINGKTYYYDVDIELQNKGKGQGDYCWYKKTKSQSLKNHIYSNDNSVKKFIFNENWGNDVVKKAL